MKASIKSLYSSDTPEVEIEHNGEKVSFVISAVGRDRFKQNYDVFEQINAYWASLPESSQARIAEIYREIDNGFYNIRADGNLTTFIAQKVAELCKFHDLDVVQDWVSFKSNIVIPNRFSVEYHRDVDNTTTREKTYTRMDYLQLVTLSLVLRIMIPIWGKYISSTRSEIGTEHKDYYAFQLLNASPLARCHAMNRLATYVNHNIKENTNNLSNFLKIVSPDDFSYHHLARVVIRRLSIEDIRGDSSDRDLIRVIYKFIASTANSQESDPNSNVREKKLDEGGDEHNKTSSLETYKFATNISDASIVEIQVSVMNMVNEIKQRQGVTDRVRRLSMNIDDKMLLRSMETAQRLDTEDVALPQRALMSQVMSPVISPHGNLHLHSNKDQAGTLSSVIGIAEAALWARGHKYLALVVSSFTVRSEQEMSVSPMDSKMRIPKEISDELNAVYSLSRYPESKKNSTRAANRVEETINLIVDNLAMGSWRMTAHESMIIEVLGTNTRRLPIRPDIKTHLARFFIETGKRSWI